MPQPRRRPSKSLVAHLGVAGRIGRIRETRPKRRQHQHRWTPPCAATSRAARPTLLRGIGSV